MIINIHISKFFVTSVGWLQIRFCLLHPIPCTSLHAFFCASYRERRTAKLSVKSRDFAWLLERVSPYVGTRGQQVVSSEMRAGESRHITDIWCTCEPASLPLTQRPLTCVPRSVLKWKCTNLLDPAHYYWRLPFSSPVAQSIRDTTHVHTPSVFDDLFINFGDPVTGQKRVSSERQNWRTLLHLPLADNVIRSLTIV